MKAYYLLWPNDPPGSLVKSNAPQATMGIDTTGDGKANVYVTGVDMNRDGIPDALQTVPLVGSVVPQATMGIDTTGDGKANMYVTGVDTNRDGIPDALQPQATVWNGQKFVTGVDLNRDGIPDQLQAQVGSRVQAAVDIRKEMRGPVIVKVGTCGSVVDLAAGDMVIVQWDKREDGSPGATYVPRDVLAAIMLAPQAKPTPFPVAPFVSPRPALMTAPPVMPNPFPVAPFVAPTAESMFAPQAKPTPFPVAPFVAPPEIMTAPAVMPNPFPVAPCTTFFAPPPAAQVATNFAGSYIDSFGKRVTLTQDGSTGSASPDGWTYNVVGDTAYITQYGIEGKFKNPSLSREIIWSNNVSYVPAPEVATTKQEVVSPPAPAPAPAPVPAPQWTPQPPAPAPTQAPGVTLQFLPGTIGIIQSGDLVRDIQPGSQAAKQGVRPGWRIKAVGDATCRSFVDKPFRDAAAGAVPYTITFSTQ